MKHTLALALLISLSTAKVCPAEEAKPAARAKAAPVFETTPIRNLLIEFHLEYQGQTVTHKLLAQEGTQNNYVLKESSGTSLLVNSLPTAYPNTPGFYSIQFQFEYRGEKGSSVQLQNEIIVREGRETVLLDDPGVRLTLKVAPKEIE
ncbi:MAG: hypothetical protein HY922_11830 [Elusimicrobia bacterium]|nr:hypothetical protein [Elusimicrobiota bacterium]